MKVILAKNAGFCNGVKSAVNQAVSLAEKYGKIYTLGELVRELNVGKIKKIILAVDFRLEKIARIIFPEGNEYNVEVRPNTMIN